MITRTYPYVYFMQIVNSVVDDLAMTPSINAAIDKLANKEDLYGNPSLLQTHD